MNTLMSALASFNGPAAVVLLWVGQALVFGTALALMTWLVTSLALRRTRPALHAGFWVIVLVKFVIPIGPEFSYSLSSLVSAWSPVPLHPLAAASSAKATMPVSVGGGAWIFYAVPLVGEVRPASASAVRPWPVLSLIALAYFGGLGLVAGLRVAAYARFARRCRVLETASSETTAAVARIARGAGAVRVAHVRISDTASAPFIYGALRPTLVLARRHLDRPSEFEAVVLHEIAHLRRGDLLVRYLQWFVGTVLYFWPVVAWVNRRIDLAREHACDEWALRRGALSPAQYARCLLDCVQRSRPRLSAYAPASMAARPLHVQRRIEMILNTTDFPRAGRWAKLLAGAAIVGWTGFALSGASAAAVKSDARKPMHAAPQAFPLWRVSEDSATSASEPTDTMPTLQPAEVSLQWVAGGDHTATVTAKRILLISAGAMASADDQPVQIFALHADGGAPEMDADGDGNVTPQEHDAYVVAKAMANPDAVLAHYPDADADHDGALSADEAADLVGDPFEAPLPAGELAPALRLSAEGQVQVLYEVRLDGAARQLNLTAQQVDVQLQDGAQGCVTVTGMATDGSETTDGVEQNNDTATDAAPAHLAGLPFLRDIPILGNLFRTDEQDGAAQEITLVDSAAEVTDAAPGVGPVLSVIAGGPAAGGPALPPAAWIMANIDATPSMKDVGAQVDRTLAASLRRFLKMHPQADRDHDGVLTVKERDAFIDRMQSSTRERYLKAHPEADTDGDGILTQAEMRANRREQRELRIRKVQGEAAPTSGEIEVEGVPAVQMAPAAVTDGPK